MFRFSSPVTLQLARGELIAWPHQSGVKLHVIAGAAWVTQRDDPVDHVLRPGQSMLLRRGAHALISAECDAALRFEAPTNGFWALMRALRGSLPKPRRSAKEAAATVAG